MKRTEEEILEELTGIDGAEALRNISILMNEAGLSREVGGLLLELGAIELIEREGVISAAFRVKGKYSELVSSQIKTTYHNLPAVNAC